jgi:hypothetical protein
MVLPYGLFKYRLTFLGLAKVGFRKHQSSNLVQKFIESTNVQPSTKAPLLPNPSYVCKIIKLAYPPTLKKKEQGAGRDRQTQ